MHDSPRVEGDVIATGGIIMDELCQPRRWPTNRGSPVGRAILDRETIHVHDLAEELETEFPESRGVQQRTESGPFFVRRCSEKAFRSERS